MQDTWEKSLACAVRCTRCGGELKPADKRILSVYDHQAVCMDCKKEEESRPDYETVSREMVGSCMAETELTYSDQGGFCFYHFYPFTCE